MLRWLAGSQVDVNLRNALGGNQDCRAKLAAGYLYPSLGHYSEHFAPGASGIREAYWSSHYIAQSTRGPSVLPAAPWDGTFHICEFNEKGKDAKMHDGFSLPEKKGEDLVWWTAAITVPELPAGRAMIDRKQAQKSNKKHTMYWRPKHVEVKHTPPPEQLDDSAARFGQIKVSSYQILDENEDTLNQQSTSFQRRLRAAVAVFLRRNFTNSPEMVGSVETISRNLNS